MAARRKRYPVFGVFETRAAADRAVAELKKVGFDDDDIGMVYRDAEGKTVKTGAADDTYAEEGAAIGAGAGALGGAAVGAGLAFGVIPAIGPALAIGALGTILLNAATGAAIGGLAGALIGWGIPEEDAEFYENEIKTGRYLVLVDTKDRADEARTILHRGGGYDRTGWSAVRADRANTLREGVLRTEDGRTIQLNEEQLRTHKETVNSGDVKVRKEVKTEHKQISVPVEREEVVIERRPARGRSGANVRSEEIRIPVKEEKVRVSKETVAKEDVRVGKRKVQDTQTVGGDVRREELVVESEGRAKVRQDSKTNRR